MQRKSKTHDNRHKRFVENARELGCDEDENRFNTTLKKIARNEPQKKNGKGAVSPS